MLIHANSSASPPGGGNWLFTSPSVRFGPNAPPPILSSGARGLALGFSGSKYDQPRVWQRAQLFMNNRAPSLADSVVCNQSCATWSVFCFWSTSFVYSTVLSTLAPASKDCAWSSSAWAAATHLVAAAWVAGLSSVSRPTHANRSHLSSSRVDASCAFDEVVPRLST